MSKDTIMPSNVDFDEVDLIKAKAILKDNTNYVVRYLRDGPTVGYAKVPIRDEHGAVLSDLDPAYRRVICSGVPYGCMIGFKYNKQLIIGWSKRIDTQLLAETHELHTLFSSILDKSVSLRDKEEDYQVSFDMFRSMLSGLFAFQQPKDVEIAFSKTSGKIAAIIRGLHDTIAFTGNGNLVESACSGPVPHDVAKNLRWFISQSEQAFGIKAVNVSYPNQEITVRSDTLPVA